jgi:excisionase family DNA binding protein
VTTSQSGLEDQLVGAHLLTIDEAASYLAIPKATLYTWRTRRVGFGPPAVKIGGSLRFRRTDLDAWIEAHLEAADQDPNADEPVRGKAPNPTAGVSLSRHSAPR